MNIVDNFIRLGCNNRPGYKLKSVRGLIIHYIGVTQKLAEVIRNNFENTTRYGATQYICDYNDGHIIRTMPEDEVAYHCGANTYRPLKNQICGNDNPNYYLVGIETCIESVENSRPSDIQWNALVQFSVDFLTRHGLGVENIYLHNEIAPTSCYKYFIDNPVEWKKFKSDVQFKLDFKTVNEELTEEDIKMYEKLLKRMEDLESKVRNLENQKTVVFAPVQKDPINKTFTVNQRVTIKTTSTHYATGQVIPSRYKGQTFTIQQVENGKVLLKELYSWVLNHDLV